MANPNLVRKPSDSPTGGAGEVTSAQILDTAPNDQNYIMNGAFDFWQRGTSASVGVEINGPMDRWAVGCANGSAGELSVTRSTDVPSNGKSTYSAACTVSTASSSLGTTDLWGFFQKLEGSVVAPLYNEKITLSFWVKSSITGTYSMWVGAGASNNGYYVSSYVINASNVWEQKSITIDMSAKVGTWATDNTIGMYVYFALATGSTFNISTPNTWTSSAASGLSVPGQVNLLSNVGNTFLISQVMLNRGTIPSPFIRYGRHYSGEFIACLRYYEKSYPIDITPGTPGQHNGQYWGISLNAVDFYDGYDHSNQFQVQKRALPSVQVYNPQSGATGNFYNYTQGVTQGNSGVRGLSTRGVSFYCINANMPVQQVFGTHWTADAEL